MKDVLVVGRFESGRDLNRQAEPFLDEERAVGQQLGERLPIEVSMTR